ncbi:MAG: endonuclease/exonuclease/phosphatase family protein [Betaproteobacteria bacterium]|nr:endonuclease/exonuclease/phosphatase family protein [Betaproteobacteria bacterium]
MKLITWNIQWCRGVDGRVDPARVALAAAELCDPDICCFQEVAANFSALAGSSGENQPELLASQFRGYSAHFACAVDVHDASGGRRRFGNLVLSRLPVRQVLRHSLPWPPEPGEPSMPRIALEAVIEAPWGLVSVTTTHLEYYSAAQRSAQVERICDLESERNLHAKAKPATTYSSGPFQPFPRPASSILTGDFNMRPEDPLVARLRQIYTDAWTLAHPAAAHPPTFCVHDREHGETPYCCDFVFVSRDLSARVASVEVNADTRVSDHQPVIVRFRD